MCAIRSAITCSSWSALLCLMFMIHLPGCSDESAIGSRDASETGARLMKGSDGVVNGLSMLSTATTDADLSRFADYDTIEILRIQECGAITGSGLEVVGQWPRLTEIELVQTPVTDAGLLNLKKAGALKTVLLSDISATDEGLVFLGSCPQIESLRLESLGLTDAGLSHLSGLSKLTSLSLEDCSGITGAGFADVAVLPGLADIKLAGTGILPDHAENLGLLTNAREILLDTDKVTDDVTSVLGTLVNLERLSLYLSPVTDAGLAHLSDLLGLKFLELSGCRQITTEGLKALEGHPSLVELDLSGATGIDNGCIPILKTIHSLKTVKLQDTPFSGEGARQLKELLPECTIIYGNSPNTNEL